MFVYVVKRLLQSLLTVLLLIAVIFIIVRAIGDPTHLLLPPEATEADRQVLRQQMGLDRPLPVQFGSYLVDLAHGQFGNSYRFSKPALEVVLGAVTPTLLLAVTAMLLALAIGIPLGIASAIWPYSPVDQLGKFFAVFGQAAPP